MRSARVYRNGQIAGILTEDDLGHYEFRYDDTWFSHAEMPSISLTLPKTKQVYSADHLFPFFFNLLSEGANRDLQCRLLRIDQDDDFGLLLATAMTDTIGAITVEEIQEK